MPDKVNRRTFLKTSAALGAGAIAGASLLPNAAKAFANPETADISIVKGEAYFDNTIKALDLLGGMKRFISKGDKVGLLINSDFTIKSTYTSPDLSIAVVKMCFDAGASEVRCIQNVKDVYWERSTHFKDYQEYIEKLTNTTANQFPAEFSEEHWTKIHVDGAVSLGEVECIKYIFDCDVFINIPIMKHHASTILTGGLKNMMGLLTRKSNVTFHLNGPEKNDHNFLAQCIADINLVRKPDLIVADATEFLVTNGPSGPGKIKKSDLIMAGTDIVAMDILGMEQLDATLEQVITIQKAYEHGLGETDLTKKNIVRA